MNLTLLVGILIAEVFVVMLLYLLFGQITVRKLRKNPETKQSLGIEFVSGWDILNVAQIQENLSFHPLCGYRFVSSIHQYIRSCIGKTILLAICDIRDINDYSGGTE